MWADEYLVTSVEQTGCDFGDLNELIQRHWSRTTRTHTTMKFSRAHKLPTFPGALTQREKGVRVAEALQLISIHGTAQFLNQHYSIKNRLNR